VEERNRREAPEFTVHSLLKSPTVRIRDTKCQGSCRSMSPEECTITTQMIFPYRGVYVHHVGDEQAVALFFNAHEGYRVSHPVAGGDGSLTLVIEESQLQELAPLDILRRSSGITFRRRRLRIDARAQALVALLRHSLHQKVAEPLKAEVLALTLVRRTLGPRSSHVPGATVGCQKLVDCLYINIRISAFPATATSLPPSASFMAIRPPSSSTRPSSVNFSTEKSLKILTAAFLPTVAY
jgi:AraC family transcriptional regulator